MKKYSVVVLILLAFAYFQLATTSSQQDEGSSVESSPKMPQAPNISVDRDREYGRLPLQFEANWGQLDASAKFVSRGHSYTLFLTESEAVLSLRSKTAAIGENHKGASLAKEPVVARMRLKGSDRPSQIRGRDELPGKINYFKGRDPEQWLTGIPTYSKVEYEGVYPGVDLVYYGREGQLEYDFLVAPGSDPSQISLSFEGTDPPQIDHNGDLLLLNEDAALRLKKPVAYQLMAGNLRQPVSARYTLNEDNSVGFSMGGYKADQTLIIDPVIVYSSYLGGEANDSGQAITVDADGNAYVTGFAFSQDFPGRGQQTGFVFMTKVNPTGSAILLTTLFGGSFFSAGWGIALDPEGNIYLTGHTKATDFPTTNGAWRTNFECCGDDGFLTKLNPDGNIVYSTYLSGGHTDFGGANDVTVDSDGNAYVVGRAKVGFPSTPGAFDTSFSDNDDVFVMKMNRFGTNAIYSTALGNGAQPGGIAVDADGNAYVTGRAFPDFPTTTGAFWDGTSDLDVFVTKLNPSGSALVYSTLIKTEGDFSGRGRDIAIDQEGNALVTGSANANFPVTDDTQALFGNPRIFVTKVNPDGSDLVFSTLLGTGRGSGIATDAAGNAFVTGWARGNLTVVDAFQPIGAGGVVVQDAFVAMYDPQGSIVYSSFLGGSLPENNDPNNVVVGAIAVDGAGNAYVTGETGSADFPTASFQDDFGGGFDAFVTKVSAGAAPPLNNDLYFAQFADSADLFSEIILFDKDGDDTSAAGPQQGTNATITLRQGDGSPLTVELDGNQVAGELDVQVPSGGLRTLRTGQGASLVQGSVTVEPDGPLSGVVLFGGSVGLAGVGNSASLSDGFLAPIETNFEGPGQVNTGIAIMNLTNNSQATLGQGPLMLTLLDADGFEVATAELTLDALGQFARFVNSAQIVWNPAVDFSNFDGTLRVESSATIAATVIQSRVLADGINQFATMPVAPLGNVQAAGAGSNELFLAQFADGDGLFSQIILFNLSSQSAANVTITLKDNLGNPLSVDLNGQVVNGSLDAMIPPSGLRRFRTDSLGALQAGSVTVTSDVPVAGVILFAGSVGLAGVGNSLELSGGFSAPMEVLIDADQSTRLVDTGIAVMNLENEAVDLTLTLLDAEGNLVSTTSDRLEGMGHLAKFLSRLQDWDPELTLADLANFRGTLMVTSTGRIAATVIQSRPGPPAQFATMPVEPK